MRRPNLRFDVSLAAVWILPAAGSKAAADAQDLANAYPSSLSVTTVSGPVSGRPKDRIPVWGVSLRHKLNSWANLPKFYATATHHCYCYPVSAIECLPCTL